MSVAPVVVTYLERGCEASELAKLSPPPFVLRREQAPSAANVALALYVRVGGPWQWTDRLPWTEEQWTSAIHRDDVELWVAWIGEEVVGYFELHVEQDGVELKYFGLLPEHTGRRLGGALLMAAVDRASAIGKNRMTVNTCTLDHPAALGNYIKHGFRVLRTEIRQPVATP